MVFIIKEIYTVLKGLRGGYMSGMRLSVYDVSKCLRCVERSKMCLRVPDRSNLDILDVHTQSHLSFLITIGL